MSVVYKLPMLRPCIGSEMSHFTLLLVPDRPWCPNLPALVLDPEGQPTAL